MKLLSVKLVVIYQLVALAEGSGLDSAMRCFAKGRRPRISIIAGVSLEDQNAFTVEISTTISALVPRGLVSPNCQRDGKEGDLSY
jgi:hypothetical protein